MPPANDRTHLRLTHKGTKPIDALLQANKHLGDRQPEKAIKLYTEVLYNLSPGSIIAFLNRCLAYTCLNLPELAVADAYRALLLAEQISEDENNGLAKCEAAKDYLQAEKQHVMGDEPWTRASRRYVPGDWARTTLSSIVINDLPKGKHEYINLNKRKAICLALELRAVYRLSAALYLCGGGSRSDAIARIDTAVTGKESMQHWEWAYFMKLGDLVAADTLRPWDNGLSDCSDSISVSKAVRQRQEEEKQKTKDGMKAKTSLRKLSGYRWDTYEPEVDDSDWQKMLRSWVHKSSNNCAPHFPRSPEVISLASEPYAELRANRDIIAGEVVLSEKTPANVTTSTPEDIFDDETLTSRRFYCDACASLLVVPSDLSVTYDNNKPPPQPRSPSSHDSVSQIISESSLETGDLDDDIEMRDADDTNSTSSQKEINAQSQPPATQSTDPPADYQQCISPIFTPAPEYIAFCRPTHLIPICSVACRKYREPFDFALCHTSIERQLRRGHLTNPWYPHPIEQRKRQCLIDLLFLRIFARALIAKGHPLQDSDIVLATCGPKNQNSAGEEKPWSFLTHVVQPIRYIYQFAFVYQLDQFSLIDKCDGWMINTLMAKIDSAIRVSPIPRYVKTFRHDARLVQTLTPFDDKWHSAIRNNNVSNVKDEDREALEDKEPWIASIHPIFNMIRVADPSKGEKPNVIVVQRETLKCYATSAGGLEPAIRKGEPLLRASDEAINAGQQDVTGLGLRNKALLQGRGEPVRGDQEISSSGEGEDEDVVGV